MSELRWHHLGPVADFEPGSLRGMRVASHKLCVGHGDTGPFAVADTCPHAGGSLSEGMVDGREIVCPLHAWGFDVETGLSPDDPGCKLRIYPVRVEGEALEVQL